jgi:hypothetical protein
VVTAGFLGLHRAILKRLFVASQEIKSSIACVQHKQIRALHFAGNNHFPKLIRIGGSLSWSLILLSTSKASYLPSYASPKDNFAIYFCSLSHRHSSQKSVLVIYMRLHQLSDAIDLDLNFSGPSNSNLDLPHSSMLHCDSALRTPNCGDATFVSLSMTRRSPSAPSHSHRTRRCRNTRDSFRGCWRTRRTRAMQPGVIHDPRGAARHTYYVQRRANRSRRERARILALRSVFPPDNALVSPTKHQTVS